VGDDKMSIVDDTVLIVDTTTPLTDMQLAEAEIMFSGKGPRQRPRILVMPLYLTYTDEKKNTASILETHIGEVAGSIEELLADPKRKPIGTSQPGPLDFVETFKRADELGYRNAICLFLPSQLSKTCEMAQVAAGDFKGDSLKEIYIPLSNSGSGEVTLTLDELLESKEKDFGGLKGQADWLTENARLWIVPEGLERLRASGRISEAMYRIGSVIRAHPIISVGKTGEDRGKFINVGRIRGDSPEKIAARMVEEATDYLRDRGHNKAYVIDRNMTDAAYRLSELVSGAILSILSMIGQI
jgi:fatty acid-binding protein DegV